MPTSTSAPHFRPAKSADTGNLVALCRELYEHDGTPFHEERHRPAIAELIAHPDWGRIFMIETGGEIIGYMVFTFDTNYEIPPQSRKFEPGYRSAS